MHDGHANTYSLRKDGVKHKLKPLQEMNEKVCSAARVCVVDGRKFLDTMRREHVCFVIVPNDGKVEVEVVPIEVADLLEEFPNIFSNNVPNGLLLVPKICHQMYLILGASFPNKAMYRMTSTKSEELNRQVNELLQRG